MDIAKRVRDLLDKMTLEEKIGQLQQCGPSLVGAFEVSFEELLDMMFDGRISEEEFGRLMSTAKQDFHEDDLRAGKIGSYNGVKGAETINRLQKIAVEETRLGIPLLFGCDVIHGFRTVMPIPLAEACAWDRDLWERTARVAAKEATAAGVHMTFAPMVDVAKDARWGRISEGAGEDAYLSGCFGAAKVKGFQTGDLTGEDAMIACVKHFAGYGAAEAGRDYNRVDMSLQRLYEEYLPGYQACIKAGARAVMPAFNDINGVPCTTNAWLLKKVLREDWGFDGMTVSDANAIAECVNHGIAADRADAARLAIKAGVDMDMTSNSYCECLKELVEQGQVFIEDVDAAAADILRVKFEKGLFDHPYQTSEEREKESVLLPEYRALAREAAVKSMVLLKNENHLLPLKEGAKIGVLGELAGEASEMLGAWAIDGKGEDCASIVDALKSEGADYRYFNVQKGQTGAGQIEGEQAEKTEMDKLEITAEILQKSDCEVFLVAVGEHKEESGEAASKADISISQEQIGLLELAMASGKPVIAVVFNGRPLAMPWVAEHASAILEAWHPGVEAGNAILDILFGRVNPSGKLTTTFPYSSGQCPVYYSHINTGRPGGKGKYTSKYLDTPLEPVYPFGYGLSYTTFEYSDLSVKKQKDALEVTVTVTNTGSLSGDEIVQCYIRDLVGRRVRPVKKLVDFSRITLEPGCSQEVKFEISPEQLGYYDENMEFIVEPGEFEVFAGTNSKECLSQKIMID